MNFIARLPMVQKWCNAKWVIKNGNKCTFLKSFQIMLIYVCCFHFQHNGTAIWGTDAMLQAHLLASWNRAWPQSYPFELLGHLYHGHLSWQKLNLRIYTTNKLFIKFITKPTLSHHTKSNRIYFFTFGPLQLPYPIDEFNYLLFCGTWVKFSYVGRCHWGWLMQLILTPVLPRPLATGLTIP